MKLAKWLHIAFSLASAYSLAALAPAATNALPYRPVAAEYSSALERIVMVSANPNTLHIYDPVSQADTAVSLTKAPLSLSISPDGLNAAVGHDSLISYVNLSAATVGRTYAVSVVAKRVVLAASWIYVMPDYSGGSVSVNMVTGTVTDNFPPVIYGSGGRLNPQVNAIYGTRDGISPNDVQRYEISTGPITNQSDSPYHGDFSICGPIWFSPDGRRIYTGCATVFLASTDKSVDMYYAASLPGITSVGAFSESATAHKIALVHKDESSSYQTVIKDNYVALLDSAYLTLAAKFTLPNFIVNGNSYRPHGKWVFFSNAGDRLYVIMQADAGSGLLNDFAAYTLLVGSETQACGAKFQAASSSVAAIGGVGSANITAAADCMYRATSSADWLELVSGGYGSGDGVLKYIARPNGGGAARRGFISIASETISVDQSGATPAGDIALLPFAVVDAAYSRPLDRLVAVSADPNELHFYDPVSKADRYVPLVRTPLCVSVRPDGLYAAVGHDGWLSYINLQTLTVEKVLPVVTDVKRAVLAGNGYIYLFPARDWSDIFAVEISSWKLTAVMAIYNGRIPRLHASGNYLYVGGNWFSKWDISRGTPTRLATPSSGLYASDLWLSEDGNRMFSAGGAVYTTSEVQQLDLQPNGKLAAVSYAAWAEHSAKRQLTAVIPGPNWNGNAPKYGNDTQVQFYSDASLNFEGAVPLPGLPGISGAVHGKFAFWDSAATAVHLILQSDAASSSPGIFGITSISPSSAFKATINSVVNAASLAGGAVAAGEILTLNVAIPVPGPPIRSSTAANNNLEQIEVIFDGLPVPVVNASAAQVVAELPFGYTSTSSMSYPLQVGYRGVYSGAFTLSTAAAAPGVFTTNGTGSGQAVALNQDRSLNRADSPASQGSTLSVFITGGGNTSPSGTAGAITGTQVKRLLQAVTATVGGQAATVVSARSAPGMLEGIAQIDIKLASNTPVGNQPLVITVGGIKSQSAATIAVKAAPSSGLQTYRQTRR
jgi:uncharacterized protein (TIGR03437 family)